MDFQILLDFQNVLPSHATHLHLKPLFILPAIKYLKDFTLNLTFGRSPSFIILIKSSNLLKLSGLHFQFPPTMGRRAIVEKGQAIA